MILAHIITNNKRQAMEIINLLMDKKLLLHAIVSEKMVYQKKEAGGALEASKQTLIIGKTKALLFQAINQELKDKYPENMPWLYSIPIIYMDEDQITFLRANTAKV